MSYKETENVWLVCLNCEAEFSLEEVFSLDYEEEIQTECPCCNSHSFRRCDSYGIDRYDEDFKKMIVELYESKKPIYEIKREYGLVDATIYRWINEYGKIKTETGKNTSNHEMKKLKKENLKLKEELEILKKAIAIFTPK